MIYVLFYSKFINLYEIFTYHSFIYHVSNTDNESERPNVFIFTYFWND